MFPKQNSANFAPVHPAYKRARSIIPFKGNTEERKEDVNMFACVSVVCVCACVWIRRAVCWTQQPMEEELVWRVNFYLCHFFFGTKQNCATSSSTRCEASLQLGFWLAWLWKSKSCLWFMRWTITPWRHDRHQSSSAFMFCVTMCYFWKKNTTH